MPSNGQSRDVEVPLPVVSACGIDTVSFAWRPQDPGFWGELLRAADRGWLSSNDDLGSVASSAVVPATRRSFLLRSPIGGGRFGFFPEHDLLYCEGRAASLYAGRTAPPELLPRRLLSHAATRAALEFEQLGPPLLFEPAVVRRLDLAVELKFVDPLSGTRFLNALSGVPLPRLKSDVWVRDGRVETVYYRTPERGHVRFRIYDKGVESGTGLAGSHVRLERQLRFSKIAQSSPEALSASDLGLAWEGELGAWAEARAPVQPSGVRDAQHAVIAASRTGAISALEAERLVGWLALREAGLGRRWWAERNQRHIPARREAELRRLGVALDEVGLANCPESISLLDLAGLLKEVRTAWAAE